MAVISLDDKRKSKGRGRHKRGGGGDGPMALTIPQKLAALNEEFGVVNIGGKVVILHQTKDSEEKSIVQYMTVEAFKIWLMDDRVFDEETHRTISMAELWLKSKGRRRYTGVDFSPSGLPAGWFNLWRGFTVEPAENYPAGKDHAKHFPTLYEHVLKNIAQGDKVHARWIWGWFAHMIQRPCERIGVALVLQGKQGTGKSKLGESIGALLGLHWVMISQAAHLTGQFNAHMRACLLLQSEEAFWAGDKAAEGTLKSLVTSSYHQLEEKGVNIIQIRNLVRLLVTSNNDWVVPAAFEERRFAVFEVGEGNIQDSEYFAKIDRELANGGFPHLLTYLQRFDLGSVNFRAIPSTKALYEQKLATLDDLQSWWFDRLEKGILLSGQSKWERQISGERLHRAYCDFSDRISKGRRKTPVQFGLALKKLMPEYGFKAGQQIWVQVYDQEGIPALDMNGNDIRKRVKGYHLPDLKDCRAHFAKLVRWDVPWGDDGEGGEESAIPETCAGPPQSAGREGGRCDSTSIPDLT